MYLHNVTGTAFQVTGMMTAIAVNNTGRHSVCLMAVVAFHLSFMGIMRINCFAIRGNESLAILGKFNESSIAAVTGQAYGIGIFGYSYNRWRCYSGVFMYFLHCCDIMAIKTF